MRKPQKAQDFTVLGMIKALLPPHAAARRVCKCPFSRDWLLRHSRVLQVAEFAAEPKPPNGALTAAEVPMAAW